VAPKLNPPGLEYVEEVAGAVDLGRLALGFAGAFFFGAGRLPEDTTKLPSRAERRGWDPHRDKKTRQAVCRNLVRRERGEGRRERGEGRGERGEGREERGRGKRKGAQIKLNSFSPNFRPR
jgi:hypothetical protein